MKHHHAAWTTGLSSLAAGLLHISIVAIVHWSPFPPLEGIFFIFGGLAQCALGLYFLFKPTMNTYRLGLSMNGVMAILYLLVQFLPVPFVGEPEDIGTLSAIVVILELIAVGTSLRWLLIHSEHGHGKSCTLPLVLH